MCCSFSYFQDTFMAYCVDSLQEKWIYSYTKWGPKLYHDLQTAHSYMKSYIDDIPERQVNKYALQRVLGDFFFHYNINYDKTVFIKFSFLSIFHINFYHCHTVCQITIQGVQWLWHTVNLRYTKPLYNNFQI